MRNFNFIRFFLVFCLTAAFLTSVVFAGEKLPEPSTYMIKPSEVHKIIKMLDDRQNLQVTYPLKDAVPPEIWNLLTFDKEEAKRLSEEVYGLKAPDLVGKIAPEIKPGKYTYKDLEKYPGLKELFPPEFLNFIRPAGPPLIGSMPEFEIIPTRQLYMYPKFLEMTKQNVGKTKLDKDGYIVPMSWQGGTPFPKPSGKFKAQQVFYNFDKRTESFERCVTLNGEFAGYDRNLKRDNHGQYDANFIRLMGRTLFPPYGWFDERAEKNGEYNAFANTMYAPRSRRGTVVLQYAYDDPHKLDTWMIYVPALRRIRKMSVTDTQDPQGDQTYDDRSFCTQKITPEKYPYKFDVIAEREYLLPISYDDSSMWVDSKGLAIREAQLQRRPCYVLQMTQLDPNYLYSKRVLYVDKEGFTCTFGGYYDQKGRLYRTQYYIWSFISDIGQLVFWGLPAIQFDHIDMHSTITMQVPIPAVFSRKDFSMQYLVKKGK